MILVWGLIILGLRLLSLIPAVIDDDEAWNAASGAALKHPLEFYQRAVDNHPPGTAWFYFFVQKFSHHLAGPRLARLVLIGLMLLTAWILGEIAHDVSVAPFKKRASIITAFLFFLTCALPSPKNLSVTNEGLMLPLLSIAIGVWIQAIARNRKIKLSEQVVSGFLFAFAVLVKQTAVFFALPILVCMQILISRGLLRWKESLLWIGVAAAYLIIVVQGLGFGDFVYWNITYTAEVLARVRQNIFSQKKDFVVNTVVFAIILWPLLWPPFRKKAMESTYSKILWAWIFAAGAAVALGSGLFFHYYLLLLPPLCVFTGVLWAKSEGLRKHEWRWLGFFYVLSCGIAAIPMIQVFWGNDLFYYEKLAARIQALTRPQDSIFVWGGTASALALSQRNSSLKFVNSRFAAPPYSTPRSQAEFEAEFIATPPELFVDLHERGDNQFRVSTEVYPWLTRELADHYSRVSDPNLPWCEFYLRKASLEKTSPDFASLDFDSLNRRMAEVLKNDPTAVYETLRKNFLQLPEWDSTLRSWLSLETLCKSENCASPEELKLYSDLASAIRPQLDALDRHKSVPDHLSFEDFAGRLKAIYRTHHDAHPYAFEDPLWWASYAVVKMQPAVTGSVTAE